MSKYAFHQTDDKTTGSALNSDAPDGTFDDMSYATNEQKAPIPVQRDDAPTEDPVNPSKADSDQQLAQDEKEAIDKSNMTKDRTRGAKPRGPYQEPSDDLNVEA